MSDPVTREDVMAWTDTERAAAWSVPCRVCREPRFLACVEWVSDGHGDGALVVKWSGPHPERVKDGLAAAAA